MPKSLINSIIMGQSRYLMAETVVSLCDGFRADNMPGLKVWDAFPLLVILCKMVDNSVHRRSSNATSLARTLGMPRTTVQRRLTQLKQIGAVQQHGARYQVVATFMNQPKRVEGFKRRREHFGTAHHKMTELGIRPMKRAATSTCDTAQESDCG